MKNLGRKSNKTRKSGTPPLYRIFLPTYNHKYVPQKNFAKFIWWQFVSNVLQFFLRMITKSYWPVTYNKGPCKMTIKVCLAFKYQIFFKYIYCDFFFFDSIFCLPFSVFNIGAMSYFEMRFKITSEEFPTLNLKQKFSRQKEA
jgi:hypothetical protein